MYPKPPEYTPEQSETIDYWLKVAGSGGKGCRSLEYMPIHALSVIEEAESRPEPEIFTVFGIPAQYLAKSDTGVKGTISHGGERDD